MTNILRKVFTFSFTLSLGILVTTNGISQTTIAEQDFDSNTSWSYTSDPAAGSFTLSSDIWEVASSVSGLTMDANFWSYRDINNADNPRGSDGLLIFTDVSVAGYIDLQLAFDYSVFGHDNTDDVFYTLVIDGDDQAEIQIVDGANNLTTSGTLTSTLGAIPDGSSTVGLKIRIRQNGGGDYGGIDNVKLIGTEGMPTPPPTTSPNGLPLDEGCIAMDDFDNPVNLISFTNMFDGAFSNAGDGFQVYQRGVSATIPFDIVDDSESIFISDRQGIIDESKTDAFFGATDIQNSDNPGGMAMASWLFDVSSGFGNSLQICIDMGAMGDFETSDSFVFSYELDGGAKTTIFSSSVDESSSQDYTLAGGNIFTVNDPMLMNGVLLNNNLQTLCATIPATGNQLKLTLDGTANGGGEGFAFDNIKIIGLIEVPSMGQWALFILALLMSNLALVFMYNRKESMA